MIIADSVGQTLMQATFCMVRVIARDKFTKWYFCGFSLRWKES